MIKNAMDAYVSDVYALLCLQIWAHIEKLDADVFTENVHPLFKKAVYSGLSRPINDVSSG